MVLENGTWEYSSERQQTQKSESKEERMGQGHNVTVRVKFGTDRSHDILQLGSANCYSIKFSLAMDKVKTPGMLVLKDSEGR